MKTIIRYIPFLYFLSCADEFVPENPIDPDNPDYIPPIVTITGGLEFGQLVTQENLTINYSGNETSMLFRTRLDSMNWTGWANALNTTLEYLDEGDHQFSLQGKYTTGDTSDIVTFPFTVDAVEGPSLMHYPRRQYASQGETIQFTIIAEEVFNLAGMELVIEYEPAKIEFIGVSQGSLFDDIGNGPIFFHEVAESQGRLTITLAVWGEDAPSFTGTESIAIIDLRINQSGNLTIDFGNDPIFRDQNNLDIQIAETVPGLIVVN